LSRLANMDGYAVTNGVADLVQAISALSLALQTNVDLIVEILHNARTSPGRPTGLRVFSIDNGVQSTPAHSNLSVQGHSRALTRRSESTPPTLRSAYKETEFDGSQKAPSGPPLYGWLDKSLADLEIMESLLTETLLILDRLHGAIPASSLGFLKKCKASWDELEPMLKLIMSLIGFDQCDQDEDQTRPRRMPFANGIHSPHLSPGASSSSRRRSISETCRAVAANGRDVKDLCKELEDTVVRFHQVTIK
jgi:hypothetical protein